MSDVKLYLPCMVEKANKADYDAKFIMSATSPDRVKDTIAPEAYVGAIAGMKKLIALWLHDQDKPIGYWADLEAKATNLTGYLKLSSTGMGQFVKQLLLDEIPMGASVGFRGKGDWKQDGGIHYTSMNLLECSIVSVPAHPKAVQIAKAYGIDLSSNTDDSDDEGMSARELEIRMKALQATSAARRVLKG